MSEDIQEQIAGLRQQSSQFSQQGQYEQALELATLAHDLSCQYLEEKHPDFASSLDNLAEIYELMGDYAKAEPLYQKALQIRRMILEELHPSIANTLNNLAGLYHQKGDYVQAELLYREALTINRTTLGERHPSFSASLNNLALLYQAMGDYERAEPLLQQALTIKKEVLGETHPNLAISLNNLALLYQAMGDYVQAEPLLQQALTISEKGLGPRHPKVATSLNNLAALYYEMGRYMQAEPLYQQALKIRRTVLGEAHPDVATSLNNLAVLHHEMGDYAQTVLLYQQALAIRRTTLGEEHPDVAQSLNNLAGLYLEMGDYGRGELFYQQALTIRRTTLGEEHPNVAISLNSLAMLYYKMGDYAQAELLYQQALKIRRTVLGEAHPDVATSLNNLAVLYRRMGDYAQAELFYKQVLTIDMKALGPEHPDIATDLNNLATLYHEMGDYGQTEPLYQQALTIRRTVLGKAHPDVAQSLINLAMLYTATIQEHKAFTLTQEAMTIIDRMIGQVFSIASESQRMGYLITLQEDFNVFLSLVLQHFPHSSIAVQAGLDLVLRRKAIGIEVLATQRDALLSGRHPTLIPKLHDLTTLRTQIAQKTLAGSGLEGVQIYQQLLKEWNARKEQLEVELAQQIPEMNLTQKLQTINWQTVVKALPEGGALVEFVRFDICNFQAIPARDEARWKSAHYVAFVLCHGDINHTQLIDLGETNFIDQLITTFRASILGEAEGKNRDDMISGLIQPSQGSLTGTIEDSNLRHLEPMLTQPNREAYTSNGIALRKTIFNPLLTALRGYKRLFLAPDGDLTRLPFEVLPTDDGHHLIDEYQISYLSTGRDVLHFGLVSIGQPAAPLVVADPDFDLGSRPARVPLKVSGSHERQSRDLKSGTLHFKRLPSTLIEGEQIASLLGVQPLLQERALERHLKEYRSPRILHIATHGFFLADQKLDPNEMSNGETRVAPDGTSGSRLERLLEQRLENPLLRSGLALAGANTWNRGGNLSPEAEDGLLTAEDVSGLDLLNTELVVLSACETGLGEIHVGEGVFGLRRAFILAGTKRLIMSLWKVPDQQTQELMQDFYHRILDGIPCAEALREAQLSMKAKYAHPRYWGAFIFQGDPASLMQQ